MQSIWEDPAWRAAAHAWIEDRLAELGRERTGPITQPHIYEWSTVLRVPTTEGAAWFKANTERLSQEAALVGVLSGARPDCVPALLARDESRGWMLMPDAGVRLRDLPPEEASLDPWLDILPRYASLQLDLVPQVDRLLALGVPDLRLAGLAQGYEQILDTVGAEPRFHEARPLVGELIARVAAYDIAETIQHDDLHDGQVFRDDGREWVLDWGDACISHPFFTLSVTLEGVLAWGLDDVENSVDTAPFRDAYLAPFVAAYGARVVDAVEPALRLGWVCRAINGHVPGDDAHTLTRLRMFLDGRA
jgi:hypothetical protein